LSAAQGAERFGLFAQRQTAAGASRLEERLGLARPRRPGQSGESSAAAGRGVSVGGSQNDPALLKRDSVTCSRAKNSKGKKRREENGTSYFSACGAALDVEAIEQESKICGTLMDAFG
jgi:hypothetical protein